MPKISRIVARFSAGIAVIGLAACMPTDGGFPTQVTTVPGGDAVSGVAVSPSSATLDVGRTLQLTATLLDGNGQEVSGDVSWTSSNNAVASVTENGLVTAVAEGGATITASAGSQSGGAVVTVVSANSP